MGVQAGGDDQVDPIEPAQHEIVGLQPDRGQMVPAPPIEHPLRSPCVQDADPGRHGQVMQSRDGPMPADAGTGQHDEGGGGAHGLDRFLVRLHPRVLGCGGSGHRAIDELTWVQVEAKLHFPGGRQGGDGRQQRLGRVGLDGVARPGVDPGQPEEAVPSVRRRAHPVDSLVGHRKQGGHRGRHRYHLERTERCPVRGVDAREHGHSSPQFRRRDDGHEVISTAAQPRSSRSGPLNGGPLRIPLLGEGQRALDLVGMTPHGDQFVRAGLAGVGEPLLERAPQGAFRGRHGGG